LNEALTGANRVWVPAAPVVVVYAARPEDDFRRDGADYYLFDCGLSAENLMLQAEHMGLRVHPMAGWDEAAVREALAIPDAYRVVVLIAVGYPGDPHALPERLRERELGERSRKRAAEVFFRERWGQGWE
ncbi:MAG: nitroreductase family protein, partial [Gemmatimonadetes bacterium]|nr:nitroreductase family protein [Gemmatimonadota bacterium]